MKIIICGNYGAGNLGDELILKGLIKMLRSIPGLEIKVMSANPPETKRLHAIASIAIIPTGIRSILRGIFAFSAIKTWRAIKEADCVLFGGGELFNEQEPYSLYLWGIHARAFQKLRKKYIIIGQSFSGLTKNWSKKIVENAVNNACEIFVRDQESRDFLYLLDTHKKIHVTTDPAFILDESDFDTMPARKEEAKTLIILRNYKNIDTHDTKKKIIEAVSCELGQKTHLKILDIGSIKEPLDYYWNLFKSAEMVFAMRLHAAILAILVEKPFLALSYSPKVENMMKKIGLIERVLTFPLDVSEMKTKLIQDNDPGKIKLAKAEEHEKAQNQQKILTRLLI